MKLVAFVYLSNYENWPLGGMLNYVKNIRPYFESKENWKVDFWGGRIIGEAKNEEIYEYTLINTKKKIVPNFVRSFIGIIKNRKKFYKYDILYSHTSATTIALKLCYPKKIVVHHQHGLSYKFNHGFIRILNLGYFLAQLMADVSFFVASKEEVSIHKSSFCFRDKRFYAVGSPVDISLYKKNKQKHDKIRFIYTGRIDEWKNITLLVRSFELYNKENRFSSLTIVGDGPDMDNIRKLVSELKLTSCVRLTGRLEKKEIISELTNSDVFVFPSNGEGVSLSIIEALAASLPVVGLDVIGVRDFIIPGKTGFFSKDKSPKEFASAMKSAVESVSDMSINCANFVENYDSRLISHEICSIIDKL